MSAEIPGLSDQGREAASIPIDLVTKILKATGERTDVSYVYGDKIGSYTGRIIFSALERASLLSSNFNIETFRDAVDEVSHEMGINELVETAKARVDGGI